MSGRRWAPAAGAAVVVAVALAGCGSSSAHPGAVEPTIQVQTEPGVGPVLTDPSGAPLYLFTRDGRHRPTCTGACAQTWLPLVVPADASARAGPGVRPALLGTVASPGGGRQVTYGGWPLYTYLGDQTTFSVSGNGKVVDGGTWWAVRPDGVAAG